ncbi:MAG: hypothetical protein R3F11_25810 [Verrucomicrobiales bacterium]
MMSPMAGRITLPGLIEAVRASQPKIVIEILVPDFNGKDDALETVMDARCAHF